MKINLSSTEKEILRRNGVSVETYSRRLKLGWSEDNALFLDSTFRSSDHNIFKNFYANNETHKMTPSQYYSMKGKKLNYEIVQDRLEKGVTMNEAVTKKYGELKSDLYTDEEIEAMNKRNNKRQQSIDYAQLLFGQMMKNFITDEEYEACVRLN